MGSLVEQRPRVLTEDSVSPHYMNQQFPVFYPPQLHFHQAAEILGFGNSEAGSTPDVTIVRENSIPYVFLFFQLLICCVTQTVCVCVCVFIVN